MEVDLDDTLHADKSTKLGVLHGEVAGRTSPKAGASREAMEWFEDAAHVHEAGASFEVATQEYGQAESMATTVVVQAHDGGEPGMELLALPIEVVNEVSIDED